MKYYIAENNGHGFITHSDNEFSHIDGYPANIWVTENTSWAARVGGVEITKEEAQTLINSEHSKYIDEVQAYIDSSDMSEEILSLQLKIQNSSPPILP
jgi:hypothetical protein